MMATRGRPWSWTTMSSPFSATARIMALSWFLASVVETLRGIGGSFSRFFSGLCLAVMIAHLDLSGAIGPRLGDTRVCWSDVGLAAGRVHGTVRPHRSRRHHRHRTRDGGRRRRGGGRTVRRDRGGGGGRGANDARRGGVGRAAGGD